MVDPNLAYGPVVSLTILSLDIQAEGREAALHADRVSRDMANMGLMVPAEMAQQLASLRAYADDRYRSAARTIQLLPRTAANDD